jgi:hypothetical protein
VICDVVDETRDSSFSPSRLLKLFNGEPLSCRLLVPEDEGLANGSRYVALSHCWEGILPS